MPGTRDRNLRSGDLSEGFGLELLRPFAFVATVPRPEDVGVDAVATLFKREGRRLLAEDSFLVQVKSASVRAIEFEGDALNWLRNLKLPFCFLSVDLRNTVLELRSVINASGHPNYRDRKKITMFLDETPFDLVGDEMQVYLGPPILRWTPADAADEDFQNLAHQVLKAWTTFELENIGLRSLGLSNYVQWETNRPLQQIGAYALMHQPSERQGILEKVCPYVQLLSGLAFGPKENTSDLIAGLLHISQYMRRQGVDPDPNGIWRLLAKLHLETSDSSPGTPVAPNV
jgi:hypothetical protein